MATNKNTMTTADYKTQARHILHDLHPEQKWTEIPVLRSYFLQTAEFSEIKNQERRHFLKDGPFSLLSCALPAHMRNNTAQ